MVETLGSYFFSNRWLKRDEIKRKMSMKKKREKNGRVMEQCHVFEFSSIFLMKLWLIDIIYVITIKLNLIYFSFSFLIKIKKKNHKQWIDVSSWSDSIVGGYAFQLQCPWMGNNSSILISFALSKPSLS